MRVHAERRGLLTPMHNKIYKLIGRPIRSDFYCVVLTMANTVLEVFVAGVGDYCTAVSSSCSYDGTTAPEN